MTTFLAHSAGSMPPVPPQTYLKHVSEVAKRIKENVDHLLCNYKGDADFLLKTVLAAAIFHDLGKLDDENQKVLSQGGGKCLPINHVDAGTAVLLDNDLVESALIAYSHHIGLQSIPEEQAKAQLFLRDPELIARTAQYKDEYLSRHKQSGADKFDIDLFRSSDWNGISRRVALSRSEERRVGKESRSRWSPYH